MPPRSKKTSSSDAAKTKPTAPAAEPEVTPDITPDVTPRLEVTDDDSMSDETKQSPTEHKEPLAADTGEDELEATNTGKDTGEDELEATNTGKDTGEEQAAAGEDEHAEDGVEPEIDSTKAAPKKERKKRKRKEPEGDTPRPKRPPNAFMIFSQEMRKEKAEDFKQQGLKTTQIAQHIGELWRALPEDGKATYKAQSEALKQAS